MAVESDTRPNEASGNEIETAYLLGAGASKSAGYPLATEIPQALREFRERLAGRNNCSTLTRWCDEIFSELKTRRCDTIDELAWVMRNQNNGDLVNRAKAITSALMFDLEPQADLTVYRRAVRSMIDFENLELPPRWEDMRVPSNAICLTYNYDRCLEAAIWQEVITAGRQINGEMELRVQLLMNSGLSTMTEDLKKIHLGRFSVLKMHGIAGVIVNPNPQGLSPVTGPMLSDFAKQIIDDSIIEVFRNIGGPGVGIPMIFFPWEDRQYQRWTDWIQKTNEAAQSFLSRITRLRIVGYSFHHFNERRLNSLLRQAQRCRVIELFDPSNAAHLRLRSLVRSIDLRAEIVFHEGNWNP